MLGASILLIAAAAQAVLGKPIQSRANYAIKGAHPVPRQWTQVARAPKDQMLSLQIAVKQGQFSELERHLYEGILAFRTSIQCSSTDRTL